MATRLTRLLALTHKYRHISLLSKSARPQGCVRNIHTSSYLCDAQKVVMPALSPTMTEGTIVKWYIKEGEAIAPGDVLCDIQTDKAVVSYEWEEEGVLAKILKPDDSKDIKIGSLIAMIVEEGDDWQNVEIPADTGPSQVEAPAAAAAETASPPVAAPTAATSQSSQGYGPAVRSLLSMYNIQTSDVNATGPHGRLLKGDLLRHIRDRNLKPVPIPEAAPPPAPAAPVQPAAVVAPPPPKPQPSVAAVESTSYTDLELTNMRKVIAKRLTESKTTIPHAYATADCKIDALVKLRKDLIADGTKVSMNDFIIKASAVALQAVPQVNAVWTGESPRLLSNIDISVAVATPNGLITPIIKDAIGKGVEEISTTIKELAGRAREGKLKPEEFQGGSFTISNLGMFGITEFSAVINPPQACILAIGGSRIVPSANLSPETRMMVTLSSDARVVDDEVAGQFLEAFKEAIENPMLMLSHTPKVNLQALFAK